VEFRILGPLEVQAGSQRPDLGGSRQQTVLAMLLLSVGHVVSADRLLEAVYGEDLPATARSQIQICVSAIRHMLADHGGTAVISTRAQGYALQAGDGQLDHRRFAGLTAAARAARDAGQLDQALAGYRDALRLWRGPALAGLDSQLIRAAASRLDEERIAALEDRVAVELDLGRHRELAGELTELVAEFPLRERLRGQLMLALYRCERTAEALQAYRQARQAMIEDLGIEPGERLQRLQRDILRSNPALAPSAGPVTTVRERWQVPRLLATDIADFTGRAGQIVRVQQHLLGTAEVDTALAAPVVVITGQGGVGKTCLAIRSAHGLAAQFPDGQLFVDLQGGSARPLSPLQALEWFLRALGMPGGQVPEGLDERAEAYRNLLADRKFLIVLDDAASEDQVSPLLPAAGPSAVLITSPGGLAGLVGAEHVPVTVFDEGTSLELLGRIAGADRVRAQPEATSAVAGRCGHLPLALRIAGAWLAARPHRSIQQLADRLADEQRHLDELPHGELGVRASISVSYQDAGEQARQLFRRLALLDMPAFSGWLSIALLDGAVADAEDALDDLVRAQLIEAAGPEGQYRFHDQIRVFAAEQLAAKEPAADREAALRRALGALLPLAEEARNTFTFLFTDIEGSTTALRRLGDGLYAQVLAEHHALVRAGLAAHDGEEVDTQGDAFFAVFSSPRACVAAVLEIQQALAAHAWPGGEQVRVRMGIHTGEATRTATGLVGLDVHRAARLAAVGHGGQVLFSESAASLVRDSLPPGGALADLGVHRLKDLGRPEHIFQLNAAGLPAGFPPLRSLGNPALANNLPAQLATFIGRDRELAEVRSLVEPSRLVTLTGAGGSGKTRLGLQVAAELLDGTGDGVWLVELAAVTDPQDVPAAISDALGIAGQPGRPVLETLLDALMPQDILIVLDNCEHLIDACAKIADAILRRCPRVHLLATSREPLGISGEIIYRVPPLSLPEAGSPAPESCDAVALFVDRAKAQGAGLSLEEETIPLIVSVCRRLDGLPLAIELAAARLRSLSLVGLHDRLDQRFRLLTGGSRTALARQQTLRATVEWSYSLLNGPEQALLGCLSAFAETFDLDAAEAVGGAGDIEVFDVADLLGSLVDKSLVVAEPAGGALRYRLLETIRQFGAERLAEAGHDEAFAVAAAHSRHFLSVAETAASRLTGSEQAEWLARLDTDYANLRRAVEHAASDPGGTAQVLRFGIALTRYWMARYRGAEAVALLLPVLARPEAQQDPELFGTGLVTTAVQACRADIATARPLAEQAVRLARQLESAPLLIGSLSVMCTICYFTGEPEAGLPLGREAVEQARLLGDDVVLGEALSGYLFCCSSTDPARAKILFAEAIACTRRSGDHFYAGILHNNAGVHALRAGDLSAARVHLEQAARTRQAIGQRDHTPLVNLGWVLRLDGDPDGARSSFSAALRSCRRHGDHLGAAYATMGLACLAADAGEWSQAAVRHGVAQAFLDRKGEPWQDPEARYRQESLDQTRAHLGQEQTGQAYARGLALSFDDALRLVSEATP
jgi:predicted ATPase/class 3 adenylate cyclase/DNA-binding SARP family transcriptional activator